jgi:hypothetical protein
VQRARESEMNSPLITRTPRSRRGAWFFIAMFFLLLLGMAAGAFAVFFLVVRPRAAQSPAGVPAIASTIAPPPPASELAPLVSIAPSATSAPSAQRANPPNKFGCLCMPLTGETNSMCSKDSLGPSACDCEDESGHTLCPVPFTSFYCAKAKGFGGPTAKDGDPCDGHVGNTLLDGGFSNEKLRGKLANCSPCENTETFSGKVGAPCIGYRSERVPIQGRVSCSNLEWDCRRGDQSKCTELRARQ